MVKNYQTFYEIKKHFFFFFVLIYKMIDIGKERYENNDIEVIVDGIGTLWLNEVYRSKIRP